MNMIAPQLPHLRAARQFYDGMVQATLTARSTTLPAMIQQFARRDMGKDAEQAFSHPLVFNKILHGGTPAQHRIARFDVEYFACVSALNLYRLPEHTEQFKAELLTEGFFAACHDSEMEWLGIYHAETPDIEAETGHASGQWRNDICKDYLAALQGRSSRDADTLVAIRLLLEHHKLSKNHGIQASPALHEACAALLESPACWLAHYLRFQNF